MDIQIRPAGYNKCAVTPQSPEGRRWIVRNMEYQAGAKAEVNPEAVPELVRMMTQDWMTVDVS